MKQKELFQEARFDHKKLSFDYYKLACDNGFYAKRQSKKVFSMVLPPPNVTGVLHIGHALNISVSDVIARFYQLRDYDVVWIPGTDHAGIATQARFEKVLATQNRSSKDYPTRDAFYRDIFNWAVEQQQKIISQAKNLAPMLDWTQAFFTLDDYINENVNRIFIKLFNEKLIYQANKIINWDLGLQTAISDIEVVHKQQKSKLYYIKYQVDDASLPDLVVATTRPETMFGDACLFVNPQDSRYSSYVGKYVINPANQEKIPILADTYVDVNFATGVMKCTPAHDPHDYELGQKHKLPMVNIMNLDGTMNVKSGQFVGQDRFVCCENLVEYLKNNHHLDKVEEIENSVSYSSRSDQPIEPMVSIQWFVKVQPLVKKVLELQKNQHTSVDLIPKRFNKILRHWLANMNDWCISRQLAWGHQFPIYYRKKDGKVFASEKELNPQLYDRDQNVLDTWFSSALWPFLCMKYKRGKPNKYFPNTLLITGSDIIFFWVARMMLMSAFDTGLNPFKSVLITGLIRDSKGRKMSKSLNNGIDPNILIDQYGVDALRMYLVTSTTAGEDLNYQEARLQANWNFLNKLWNSVRYIFQQTNFDAITDWNFSEHELTIFDKWILARLYTTCKKVENHFLKYNFTVVGKLIVDFFWDDFCSIFLEVSKVYLKIDQHRLVTQKVLLYVLRYVTLLLHPFCPIISENIYHNLPLSKASILQESYALPIRFSEPKLAKNVIEFITFIRKLRTDLSLKNTDHLRIYCEFVINKIPSFDEINQVINKLANSSLVRMTEDDQLEDLQSFSSIFGVIRIASSISQSQQNEKLRARLKFCEFELDRARKILANQKFVDNAPKIKVESEITKAKKYATEIDEIKKLLK